MTLYFAYGSNLNLRAMARRCPKAVAICPIRLRNYRLVFRGVADCIYEPGAMCYGGVWKITPECESALDRYEGFPHMYRKEYIKFEHGEELAGEKQMMLYMMNSTGIMPPSEHYLDTIIEGYHDFGLKLKRLREAVRASWDDKAPSHVERQRYKRNGRPPLALSKSVVKRATAPAEG